MLRYEDLELSKRHRRQEEQQAQLNASLEKAITQPYSMTPKQRSHPSGNSPVC